MIGDLMSLNPIINTISIVEITKNIDHLKSLIPFLLCSISPFSKKETPGYLSLTIGKILFSRVSANSSGVVDASG